MPKVASKCISLVAQPEAYFHELLTESLGSQGVRAQPETEVYLVDLLKRFILTDRLYARDGEGAVREEPLALQVQEALEEPGLATSRALFRRIGDVSLYTAGFFRESLARRHVDLGYYIGMGASAYLQAANRAQDEPLEPAFRELGAGFAQYVEVLLGVSERTQLQAHAGETERDLLKLYETWLRTKSERAARALQEAGITPVDLAESSARTRRGRGEPQ